MILHDNRKAIMHGLNCTLRHTGEETSLPREEVEIFYFQVVTEKCIFEVRVGKYTLPRAFFFFLFQQCTFRESKQVDSCSGASMCVLNSSVCILFFKSAW